MYFANVYTPLFSGAFANVYTPLFSGAYLFIMRATESISDNILRLFYCGIL